MLNTSSMLRLFEGCKFVATGNRYLFRCVLIYQWSLCCCSLICGLLLFLFIKKPVSRYILELLGLLKLRFEHYSINDLVQYGRSDRILTDIGGRALACKQRRNTTYRHTLSFYGNFLNRLLKVHCMLIISNTIVELHTF